MTKFDIHYEALKRRDPSHDGVIFVAVKTTGIYCRPVCPSPTPLARNVLFFPSAAAAEVAGYRACLRCRPESVPFCPAWKGSKTTVERALTLIEAGDLDRSNIDRLATRLGISSRQLHRLFVKHIGASPTELANLRRVHRAKSLLDTGLSIAAIAKEAGFPSSRRMAAAFSRLYGMSPTNFRNRGTRT